jgi:NAD(P)-dependent dehydrogenase (short-subunit alcohol dehydrogenase family)
VPTAIVTGGAIRIGRAMALHLAKRGFNIALLYHSSGTAGEETISKARSHGIQCKGYAGDLRILEETELLIGNILKDFNDVELLVNSAANFIQENVEQTQLKTLVDTLSLNLLAPYLLMREYKRKVNKGLVINILDERVAKTLPTFAAYSISKVGLKHLTELAALEWGKSVRVNGIAPGLILPPQGGPSDYLEKAAKSVPTGTHGSQEDIIKALDYLMENKFVNGETLFVDGGGSL